MPNVDDSVWAEFLGWKRTNTEAQRSTPGPPEEFAKQRGFIDWASYIAEWEAIWANLDASEEFELLRREGPKWSSYIYKRLGHLEGHLDRGELECNCGKS